MRNQQRIKMLQNIDNRYKGIQQFYDPLKELKPLSKPYAKPMSSCIALFDQQDDQEDFIVRREIKLPQKKEQAPESIIKSDNFLKKIFANSKKEGKEKKQEKPLMNVIHQYEPFCFNSSIVVKYPQTPHFKNQLQSPFWKFNADHKVHIESLKQKTIKAEFQPIDLNADPLNYITQCLKFFVGISLNLKEKECINASRALLKLGCYVQPFNERAWKKYIQFQEQCGYIYKTFILSKTAFLFTQNEQFAKMYITYGQKCQISLAQMRGILNSAENTQIFQKGILAEIGKLTLKHQPTWKGLKIIFQICNWNEFRLPVCALIIFLAKYLENIGETQKALLVLKRSFGRGMSKLEVYTNYLEMKVRQDQGGIRDSVIKEVLEHVECISSQNRYRLYLQIAEILYLNSDARYKAYIQSAFVTARKFCAPGTGCNKALRHIYYTLLRMKNINPLAAIPSDNTSFEQNRYNYINHGQLTIYEFTDWKYYLHYGLIKRIDILQEASKKWSYTGRLIAQWIHTMRENYSPKQLLRIWRQKIDEVPKSGELWCQGGRIYSEMHDYQNASKCFKAAIHFTPQYGDSFIEQLRIYLIRGQVSEANKLKKIMFVSQPFYGHVWSFLRQSKPNHARLTLNCMWEYATLEINNDIYKDNLDLFRPADKDYRLLTAFSPYNKAYLNPDTPQKRMLLFASYEQIDKN